MTDPYPQNPYDSMDFLNSRAVNAENKKLKAEISRLNEIIKTLHEYSQAQENHNVLEQNRELKSELLANAMAHHLLSLRIDNAISYLSGTSHYEARISAALSQLKQAQKGR